MRRFVIRFVVALTTFTFGMSATAVFSPFTYPSGLQGSKNTLARLTEEAEITRMVFRRQIEEDSNPKRNTYYLSCYNYSDPPTKVMSSLVERGLPAKALSEVPYGPFHDNSEVVFLRVGSIKWISDEEVVLGGSLRGNRWSNFGTRAYLYRLVRDDRGWKIISAETIS